MKFHQTSTATIGGNAFNKEVKLSKVTPNNIESVTKTMVDVLRRQKKIWRKELNDWQAARNRRYSIDNPSNFYLQEVYDDAMMDGHLTAVTGNRTLRSTLKTYVFAIDDKRDDKLTNFIRNKQWFEKAIEEAHTSTYRGGICLFINDFHKGEILNIEPIPYGLYVPEKKQIINDFTSMGLDITKFEDILLHTQLYDHIGILEKAFPYTCLKRHSWGSWDEFEELFGIPIRIAKVASQSDAVKNEVAGWLQEMGSAAYGVFPTGTEIEIKENTKGDAFNVFFQKIKALDAEMSKLVVHQTMTTDNGASKAQGNVHENTLLALVQADEKKMLSWLNDVLVPAMRNIGYNIPENARIIIEQTKDAGEQIKIDGVLLGSGYILKKDYIEQVYGVEIETMPSGNQLPAIIKNEDPGKE
ncbi:DUF935 domain-containing protein [Chryseobacterium herbae]|uniref:DUF935 domain-containing protein n=1 Tax=Chryseobacterium herbae TaxID=2976476 RepID=A0ABT2IYP1_9FLAO|nr:DUF935 domain-containing protein [Chryseobacterium sp. pc1-10]MCT2563963.1 DUF935 domain-containing protein [Chryseobacterium sp. pc1-10]